MRPLTSINSGLAQSFDSSQLVNSLYARRMKREEALQKSIMDYDPNSIWSRDIPEFSERMKEYRSFVSSNYDKLLRSSENNDIWLKKRQMEDGLKYFIAGSKNAQESYNQAMMRYNDASGKFRTPENQEILYNFYHPDTWGNKKEAYNTNQAFDPTPLQNMKMNVVIDREPITEILKGAAKGYKTTSSQRIGNKTFLRELDYDIAEVDNKIKSIWEDGSGKNSGEEIRNKYSNNFNEFKMDAYNMMKKYDEGIDLTDPKERKTPTKVPMVTPVAPTSKTTGTSIKSDDGQGIKAISNIAQANRVEITEMKTYTDGVIQTYYPEGSKAGLVQSEKSKTFTVTGKFWGARAKTTLYIKENVKVEDGSNQVIERELKAGEMIPAEVVAMSATPFSKMEKKWNGKDKGMKPVEDKFLVPIGSANYDQYIEENWFAEGQMALQSGDLDMNDVDYSSGQVGIMGGTKKAIVLWSDLDASLAEPSAQWKARFGLNIDDKINQYYGNQPPKHIVKFVNPVSQGNTQNTPSTPDLKPTPMNNGAILTEEQKRQRLEAIKSKKK